MKYLSGEDIYNLPSGVKLFCVERHDGNYKVGEIYTTVTYPGYGMAVYIKGDSIHTALTGSGAIWTLCSELKNLTREDFL